jgi:NFACT protein RNA binding domain
MAQTPSSPQYSKVSLRTSTLPGGWQVLIGQTDADNDSLSFQVARPDDWWFHIRGMPGSHVILQGPPGADPDRETLQRAAALAAYYSKVSVQLVKTRIMPPLAMPSRGQEGETGPLHPAGRLHERR